MAQSVDRLEGKNVSIAQTSFKGRSAVQLIAAPDANATSYAIVRDSSFRDVTIDPQARPAAGTCRVVGRARDRGLLFQSEDRATIGRGLQPPRVPRGLKPALYENREEGT
jgi:hypothetical protein